jgi:tetratricopeptide (TPR) repeat protein
MEHQHDSSGDKPASSRGRKKVRRRVAAVRLDLEQGESTATALGRLSNRIALGVLALVLTGLLVWGVRSTDWDAVVERLRRGGEAGAGAESTDSLEPLPQGEELPLFAPRGDPAAISQLALALSAARIGKHEEAARLLEQARIDDPNLVGWHYFQGVLAKERGDAAAARQAFLNSIAAGEAVAMANSSLGDFALMEGDFQEACSRYRQVLELYPGDAWVRLKLGIALRRSGDVTGGVEELRLAARLRSYDGNLRAWYHLAAWDAAGRPAQGPRKVDGLPAFAYVMEAVTAAHRGELEVAASALRNFSLEATPALRQLASVEPLVQDLAKHEALRPLVPVAQLSSSGKSMP